MVFVRLFDVATQWYIHFTAHFLWYYVVTAQSLSLLPEGECIQSVLVKESSIYVSDLSQKPCITFFFQS